MKNGIAIMLLVLAACPAPVRSGVERAGADSARQALEGFLGAARAQDGQRMAALWGDAEGPASDKYDKEQVEQRVMIMQRCFRHDDHRILNESPGAAGARVFFVELTKSQVARQTNFTTVQGPDGRWYVQTGDITPLQDLCRMP